MRHHFIAIFRIREKLFHLIDPSRIASLLYQPKPQYLKAFNDRPFFRRDLPALQTAWVTAGQIDFGRLDETARTRLLRT